MSRGPTREGRGRVSLRCQGPSLPSGGPVFLLPHDPASRSESRARKPGRWLGQLGARGRGRRPDCRQSCGFRKGLRSPTPRGQRRGPPSRWGLPRPAPWTRPPSRMETCVSTTQSRGLPAWVMRSLRPAPYGGSGGSWIQEEKTTSYLSEPCSAPGRRTQPWEAAAGGERPWDSFRSWEVLSPESWPFGTESRTPRGCSAKPGRAGSP